jgi:hypothetical protein
MILFWMGYVMIDWELDTFPDRGTAECRTIQMSETIATFPRAVEQFPDIGFHKPCKPHTIEIGQFFSGPPSGSR